MYVTDKFGFGKVLVFGSLCQIVAYAIQCAAPPFPLFVISYAINGVGIAVQVRICDFDSFAIQNLLCFLQS